MLVTCILRQGFLLARVNVAELSENTPGDGSSRESWAQSAVNLVQRP